MSNKRTAEKQYTKRLETLQQMTWKTVLDVQCPYRWNLKRLNPGRTIDVGCGIGRLLTNLPAGSVGIDHNSHSVEVVRRLGLSAFLPEEFRCSGYCGLAAFDSLLFSHILEHLTVPAAEGVIAEYLPYLKLGGAVIVICPQERGFATDNTHVTFLDEGALRSILTSLGLELERAYSFPFPRFAGKIFSYNEFVAVGRKPGIQQVTRSR